MKTLMYFLKKCFQFKLILCGNELREKAFDYTLSAEPILQPGAGDVTEDWESGPIPLNERSSGIGLADDRNNR